MENLLCKLVAFFLIFIMVSCNHQERSASLEFQDSIVFQLKKPLPQFCPAMFYYEKNDLKYFFVDDKSQGEIRIIDLNSKSEIISMPIADTGINSIPYYFGFAVKDLDSIYLPCANHLLYCINRYGEIIKKIDFSDLIREYPLLTVATSTSRFTRGAIIKGSDIFFLQEDNRKFYFSYKPSDYRYLFKYNTKNDSFGLSPISLPESFWNGGKLSMDIFLTYNDLENKFVFGMKCSDDIYTSTTGEQITRTYHSKSKLIDKYFPYSPANPSTNNKEDYFYSLCKFSYNLGLLWDSKNEVYYRFVWPGVKDLDPKRHDLISKIYTCFPTFGIEILDRDFNTIGSFSTPENKYDHNNYFLTKDGLYLVENTTPNNSSSHTWTLHLYKIKFHT